MRTRASSSGSGDPLASCTAKDAVTAAPRAACSNCSSRSRRHRRRGQLPPAQEVDVALEPQAREMVKPLTPVAAKPIDAEKLDDKPLQVALAPPPGAAPPQLSAQAARGQEAAAPPQPPPPTCDGRGQGRQATSSTSRPTTPSAIGQEPTSPRRPARPRPTSTRNPRARRRVARERRQDARDRRTRRQIRQLEEAKPTTLDHIRETDHSARTRPPARDQGEAATMARRT